MSQITAQTKPCKKCGAYLRPESAFCYNCGESITEDYIPEENVKDNHAEAVNPGLSDDKIFQDTEKKRLFRPGELNKTKKELAPALNRRERRIEKKPGVVWEPYAGTNDVRFLIFSILVFILTIVVVILALKLK